MVRKIMRDEAFLSQKAVPATLEDLPVAQDLLGTLTAHKDGCVGMVANMIGVCKRIIAFDSEGKYMVMFNPGPMRRRRESLPRQYPEGQVPAVHQGAVPERAISAPLQGLRRLDSTDHPA